jgi:ABC-type branched-subunit amino acid transport system permease subunit
MQILLSSLTGSLNWFFAAVACPMHTFFGLPTWYKYLPYGPDSVTNRCEVNVANIGQYWLIGLAILDMLVRVAGMVAIGYVVYGGFVYITSRGEADKIAAGRQTILNALVGVVIAVTAAAVIGFIGHTLG